MGNLMCNRNGTIFLLFSIGLICILSAQNKFEKVLTAADVSKASGINGIKPVAKNSQKGATGDLNFTTADGTVMMIAQFFAGSAKNQAYKSSKQYFFKEEVKGLGEAAFKGFVGVGAPGNFIAFIKGDICVTITVMVNVQNIKTNMMSWEQLLALAKVVAGRL